MSINGKIASLGTRVDVLKDLVTIDGRAVELRAGRTVCVMLYKPRGYITSRRDPHGRRTVMDLVGEPVAGLHPVGRLDYDSEGLLLLTNDGDLTYWLTHPANEVDKTYEVTVEGEPGDGVLREIREGVRLDEGVTSPAVVREIRKRRGRSSFEVTVHQGWNRQIRRMFETKGYPVVRLKRTRYAFLGLGLLKPGEYRLLDDKEIELLRKAGSHGRRPRRPVPAGGRQGYWSPSV